MSSSVPQSSHAPDSLRPIDSLRADVSEKPQSSGSGVSSSTKDAQHAASAFSGEGRAITISDHGPDEVRRKDDGDARGGIWKFFRKRKKKTKRKNDWWFASTAIPLLAATLGPLANVLSIAALVSFWRMDLVVDGELVSELNGVPFEDPRWCYWLNVSSLICGFVGNLFLLMNFTQKVRYLIALPATIILWYIATGLLTGILACVAIYVPPDRPTQAYTQGFWYGVMAAVLYCVCSMILMVNMVGYWRGHYPNRFTLTESQRTLILQTMLFFVWLAGGGGAFSRIEQLHGQDEWTFVNALYFCDVTILTVGFGDIVPSNDVTRGLVFPYSVGGIIMLGLVVSSIYKFTTDLGQENVIQKHINHVRTRTLDRTVTSSIELRRRQTEKTFQHSRTQSSQRPSISAPYNPVDVSAATRIRNPGKKKTAMGKKVHRKRKMPKLKQLNPAAVVQIRKPRLLLLREERDRFHAMRAIQHSTARFKRWYALTLSIIAFGILWCVGAVVFWQAEKDAQGMTYFQGLYFCYVSLLTIGYGDLAPKSNAGRAFFVVWSLIAVPTMTILISDMGDTVIAGFKTATDKFADVTVLPKQGIVRDFLQAHPALLGWLQRRQANRRVRRGSLPAGPAPPSFPAPADAELGIPAGDSSSTSDVGGAAGSNNPSLAALAAEHDAGEAGDAGVSDRRLAKRLAKAIRTVAGDLKADRDRLRPKKYTYEQWVEFTRLIRFTARTREEEEEEEEEMGLVEWDWIGEDSPMMAGKSEAEFVLDRLCESLGRYLGREEHGGNEGDGDDGEVEGDGDIIEEEGERDAIEVVSEGEVYGQEGDSEDGDGGGADMKKDGIDGGNAVSNKRRVDNRATTATGR